MGKLLAIVSVPVFVAALAGGLAFSLGGSSAEPASAEGDGWEAMHEACESGDFEGMLSAMEDTLSAEDHEAMLEHMTEMHSGDGDRAHDSDMGHVREDDEDDMHDDDAGHMGSGGMMGGMHGGHDH